ncbi:MAG TPA: iron-sulfur cluster insertion protein ErpA [Sphingomonadales bacterium]|nr:iron-sulfur cluster insertion protein ErpA [Sphingomonadales bacterium]
MAQSVPFTVSSRAARRIRELAAEKGDAAFKLRISVKGGGCSGFQYDFQLVKNVEPGDVVVEQDEDGGGVVIDNTSLLYMIGAEVDYTEELAGSYFKITNPKAESACGCGTSFAVKA